MKYKKLHKDAKVPSYAHDYDVGLDLFAVEKTVVNPMERTVVKTGISIEIPEGYAGLIWDKSGISIKEGVKTIGGVIDPGYRGEILVGVINLSGKEYVFEAGHKVAQIIIQKIEYCTMVESETLSETKRGAGNFGSTGK